MLTKFSEGGALDPPRGGPGPLPKGVLNAPVRGPNQTMTDIILYLWQLRAFKGKLNYAI